MKLLQQLSFLFLSVIVASSAVAEPIWFEPSPYLSRADFPADFGPEACVFIEDFEDNLLDPRLTISPGMIIPPGFDSGIPDVTDSVDGDDGSIDGSGSNGYSFFNSLNEIAVDFAAPTQAAGLVFTDGPQDMELTFEAFDTSGSLIDTKTWATTADDVFTGTTSEDRFVGVRFDDAMISRIVIRQSGPGLGIEIDHVAFKIPEPQTISMLLLGVAISVTAGLRRH